MIVMSLISWLVSVARNGCGRKEAAKQSLQGSDVGQVVDAYG